MNSKVLIWLFWQFIVRLQKCVGIEPTLILIVNNTSKVTLLKGFISVMHSLTGHIYKEQVSLYVIMAS